MFDRRVFARDGSGGYSLPYPTFTNGTTADGDQVTANNADLSVAMAASIAKDGQTVPTANLPMGNYKHTGVSNGTARTHYAAVGQVQDSAFTWCGTAGGTKNALTLTPTPAIAAYAEGQSFVGVIGGTSSDDTVTLAVSGLTTKAVQINGSALSASVFLESGKLYRFDYDGTQFQATRLSINPYFAGGTDVAVADGGTGASTAAGALTNLGPGINGLSSVTAAATDEILIADASDSNNAKKVTAQSIADLAEGGKVVQVVNTQTGAFATGTTTMPIDDTIPQNTEGTEFMTLAITPTNASNKLLVEVIASFSIDTTAQECCAALFQDSTADAVASQIQRTNTSSDGHVWVIRHYMTAGTTSSTTFKFRMGSAAAATIDFNGYGGNRKHGGVLASSMTIWEIAA